MTTTHQVGAVTVVSIHPFIISLKNIYLQRDVHGNIADVFQFSHSRCQATVLSLTADGTEARGSE